MRVIPDLAEGDQLVGEAVGGRAGQLRVKADLKNKTEKKRKKETSDYFVLSPKTI